MTPFPESSEDQSQVKGRYRAWLFAFGVSLLASSLVVAPFFWLGSPSGHDIAFHASSWLDAAGQWKEGIVFPRWTEWANHGFGEPRFIFYPPLSWMLGAALSFVAGWNAVPGVFVVVVQTLAGMCAFALARRVLPERAALFSAFCYAANPNALLIVYLRSDFAELLASAVFPLLFLVAFELAGTLENRERSLARGVGLFGIIFAVVWLSNAPAGVLASYSVTLVFIWAAVAQKSWWPLARGAAGMALGFGLAAFYIVPAAYEQRWVNIMQALSTGLLPQENFLYSQTGDPEHNFFNWVSSSAAVLMILLTGAAAIAARRGVLRGDKRGEKRKLWGMLLLLSAAATLLMFRGTAILWRVLPELRFVQFPWRWMSILAVAFAVFAGAPAAKRRGWILMLLMIVILGGTGAFLGKQGWWDGEDIPTLLAAIEQGDGFDGTDEYDPVGDDHYNLPAKAPLVRMLPPEEDSSQLPNAIVSVERWSAEEKVLRLKAQGPLRLALRLINYPAWHVEVNGREIAPERADDYDQMIVPLGAGESRVRVLFTRTWDRTFGGVLTAASLLVALFLIVRP
ncbi:MAG: hypothetical protein ACHQLQ_02575 [Candidatus Acidiferrales bacterium]